MAGTPKNSKERERSGWDTEDSFTDVLTLEELVDRPPFKETKDKHGQSVTTAARIPDWLTRKISFLRESSRTPYQLDSDVVRDAIYLGLRILHVRYREGADWTAESKMAKIADEAGEGTRMRDQFKDLVSGIEAMCDQGDEDRAIQFLDEYVIVAGALEDPWKKRTMLRLLKENKTVQGLLPKCSAEAQGIVKGRTSA